MTCPKCKTYKEWCEESDPAYTLKGNLDFGEVSYDTDAVGDLFDKFYACWFINAGCLDFEDDLQMCYDLAKDRIDKFYAKIAEFDPNAKTTMSVAYGQRGSKEYGYEYPLTGNVDTSTPNRGAKSNVDAVTDTTTVSKDEAPFKTVREFRDFPTFVEFFIDQFKDCFTLVEGVTW